MYLRNNSDAEINWPKGNGETVHMDAHGDCECDDKNGGEICARYPFVHEFIKPEKKIKDKKIEEGVVEKKNKKEVVMIQEKEGKPKKKKVSKKK